MQRVKSEAPALPATPCRLCLSTDRRTSSVERVSYAYGLVTDWAPQAGARVCWECRARLERLLRFKVQATQALQILESVQSLASGASFTSLGKHTITTYDDEVVYDADLHTEISLKPSKRRSDDFVIEIAKQENVYEDDFAIEIAKQENVYEDDFAIEIAKQENIYEDVFAIEIAKQENLCEDEMFDRDSTADSADVIDIKYVPSVKKSDMNTTTTPKKARLKGKDTNNKRFKKKVPNSTEHITEKFTPTDEELSSYREMALRKLKRKGAFRCMTCIIKFQAEDDLNSHNETFHSEAAGGHVCDVCDCRFQSEEALAEHRASHLALYRCKYPGCDFVHTLSRIVTRHFPIHGHEEDKFTKKNDSYECDYCGKVFILRNKFVAHMRIHTLKFVCELCGRMFQNIQYLQRHMLAHLDPSHRRHGCNICQKRFATKCKLLVHIRSHTGERPFQCDKCSRAFSCKDEMKRHMKVRHLLAGERKREFRAPRTKSLFINKRQFPCSNKESQNGKFECIICGMEFLSYENLQTHFAVHDGKPLHCNGCDKIYQYRSQLENHIKAVHRHEKPHTCTTCGAKFSTKTNLNTHLASHSNERIYKCDECDLTFKFNSGLWMHKQSHKGEKPHQCTICGSRFTIRGNLTGHMKTHSNEKPFECNVCGRKFPWKRNLKNHFKTHSKEQQV